MATIVNLLNNPAPDDFSNKKRVIRDAAVEFVSTTMFVFCGTLSAVSTSRFSRAAGKYFDEQTANSVFDPNEDVSYEDVGQILPIALSFGISIMFMVYSIGHLTGGHMNPAVSLMMFFKGEMSIQKMLAYWFAQFTGALLASSIVWGCSNSLSSGEYQLFSSPPINLGATTINKISVGNAFFIEFMGSLIFYFVIAQTALDKRGIANTGFPAIPIGFCLVVIHICLIPFTGCGVNPARTFGPSMVTCMADTGKCSTVVQGGYWIYYVSPFLASFFAAEISCIMSMDVDGEATKKKEPEESAI